MKQRFWNAVYGAAFFIGGMLTVYVITQWFFDLPRVYS